MCPTKRNVIIQPWLLALGDAGLICLVFWLLSTLTLRLIALACATFYHQPFNTIYATLIYEPLALASAQALAAAFVSWTVHTRFDAIAQPIETKINTQARLIAMSAVAGLAMQWPLSKLAELASTWFAHDAFYERLPSLLQTTPQARLILMLALVVLPATSEELLFRGALYLFIRQRTKPLISTAITAVLFALSHGFTPALLPAFVAGIALGAIREKTQTLGPCIAFHAGVNAAPFLFR